MKMIHHNTDKNIQWIYVAVMAVVFLSVSRGYAEEPLSTVPDSPATQPVSADTTWPATQPVSEKTSAPSAQEIMEELLLKRMESPAIETATAPAATLEGITGTVGGGGIRLGQWPAGVQVPAGPTPVLSTAPGISQSPLRKVGEFLMHRRGRVVLSPDGRNLLFVFDSESEKVTETPVVLLPSVVTQRAQALEKDHWGQTVFLASGQILVYQGVNYLLPTALHPDVERGNLQP